MRRGLFAIAAALAAPSLPSQDASPARNLGLAAVTSPFGTSSQTFGDLLVLAVSESGQRADLNGDGDMLDLVLHVHDLAAGTTANLGLARGGGTDTEQERRVAAEAVNFHLATGSILSGRWLVIAVSESGQGADLNGDGDLGDPAVVHVHDLEARRTANLGLAAAAPAPGRRSIAAEGSRLVMALSEADGGRDLNGDGDVADAVVHVHDLEAGTTTNLGLAGSLEALTGSWAALRIDEASQDADLDGDGDLGGEVVHVHDFETQRTVNLALTGEVRASSGEWLALWVPEDRQGGDLNGDGDTGDTVVHVHVPGAFTATNLGLAAAVEVDVLASASAFAFAALEAGEGRDLNGDGDLDDSIIHVHDVLGGSTRNLALAGPREEDFGALAGRTLVLRVPEVFQGADLNGDGDAADDDVVHVHDLATGATANLRIAGDIGSLSERWLVLWVSEPTQGADLNGDGDAEDGFVVRVVDLETRALTGPDVAGWSFPLLSDSLLVIAGSELLEGSDLNGDGDVEDSVFHTHDLEMGKTSNLALAGGGPLRVSGSSLVLMVAEFRQHVDLNGDGDREDGVAHVHDAATGETTNLGLALFESAVSGDRVALGVWEAWQGVDLNGDGDLRDGVVEVRDLRTGGTARPGLAGTGFFFSGDWLVLEVAEEMQGRDLNGDGDAGDVVLHVLGASHLLHLPTFRRADPNGDGRADLADGVFILEFLFASRAEPACLDAADTDDDGGVVVTDAIFLLNHLFVGGAAPPPPLATCGTDGTDDALGCIRHPACGGGP
jgi:hypothetical protein